MTMVVMLRILTIQCGCLQLYMTENPNRSHFTCEEMQLLTWREVPRSRSSRMSNSLTHSFLPSLWVSQHIGCNLPCVKAHRGKMVDNTPNTTSSSNTLQRWRRSHLSFPRKQKHFLETTLYQQTFPHSVTRKKLCILFNINLFILIGG